MTYRFDELVDLPRLSELMVSFYQLTGLPSAIVDLEGNILIPHDGCGWRELGWQGICFEFHRVHPVTAARCRKSDTELSCAASNGRAAYYNCLNGLVDVAFPVFVDGVHLVNLFTGQFFLEPPDREAFRRQAAAFDFDQETYLADLERVPVFSRDYVDRGMRFLEMLAVMIGDMGKQTKDTRDLNQVISRESEVRSRFFASASHDLRQPLQALRLFLDLLSSQLADTRHAAVARRADDALVSTEAILNALFDIARIQAGVVAPAPCFVDMADIFAVLLREFTPQAAAQGIRLRRRLTRPAIVWSDPMMLERVLRNLLTNAIRHAGGGDILLACRRRGNATLVEVWDNGPGIPADHLALIWEEFYQIGSPSRDRAVGLGLGLSIARKLTRSLDHGIEACSREGSGTRFRVVIADQAEARDSARLAAVG